MRGGTTIKTTQREVQNITIPRTLETGEQTPLPKTPLSLYMVGKRRFAALKWILVCENRLRIDATGVI